MIIYEKTNILVSAAFLKCFSILISYQILSKLMCGGDEHMCIHSINVIGKHVFESFIQWYCLHGILSNTLYVYKKTKMILLHMLDIENCFLPFQNQF